MRAENRNAEHFAVTPCRDDLHQAAGLIDDQSLAAADKREPARSARRRTLPLLSFSVMPTLGHFRAGVDRRAALSGSSFCACVRARSVRRFTFGGGHMRKHVVVDGVADGIDAGKRWSQGNH